MPFESRCPESAFEVFGFIHEESIAYSLARLSEAQWVFGGAQGTQYAGIPSIAFTKIDKNQARPNDVVTLSERQI